MGDILTIDLQTIVLAVISSNILSIVITAWLNRRRSQAESDKIRAETEDTRVNTALKLVDELQDQLTEGNSRFRDYRQTTDETIAKMMTELKVQEKAIDNLTAKTLKYQLVLSILIMQLRQGGLEPLVDPQEIEMMKIEDLRIIAQGMSNVEERRQRRQQERNNGD